MAESWNEEAGLNVANVVPFNPFAPVRRTGLAAAPPVAQAPSTTVPWGLIGLGVASLGVLGLYLYSRRAGDVPILVKGRDVRLVMTDGRVLRSPRSYGMIHDPSGTILSSSMVYIGPFRRSARDVDLDANGQEYFGSDYDARAASLTIPVGPWKDLGEVHQIIYDRDRGEYAANRPYEHVFSRSPEASQAGAWRRLELPLGSRLNWRGFLS